MHFFKKFFAFIAIFTASISVYAQQLWNGTSYGMTEQMVKSMFPNVVRTKSKSTIRDSAIPVYDLNEIDLEGEKFTATFYFKDKKLIKVRLYPQEMESIERTFFTANRLEEILIFKYGAPYESKGEVLKYKIVKWKNKSTEIMLVALSPTPDLKLDKKADVRNLVIVYEAEFADAASKL